jgi:hypothetical protein
MASLPLLLPNVRFSGWPGAKWKANPPASDGYEFFLISETDVNLGGLQNPAHTNLKLCLFLIH